MCVYICDTHLPDSSTRARRFVRAGDLERALLRCLLSPCPLPSFVNIMFPNIHIRSCISAFPTCTPPQPPLSLSTPLLGAI